MSKARCRPANGPIRTAPRNTRPRSCCRISAASSPCSTPRVARAAVAAGAIGWAPARRRPASSARKWTTRFRSDLIAAMRIVIATVLTLALAGCATSSGVPANGFLNDTIARAYIPLEGRTYVVMDNRGAAFAIAPGIAVTNVHNSDALGNVPIIGQSHNYDLLYFRVDSKMTPPTVAP